MLNETKRTLKELTNNVTRTEEALNCVVFENEYKSSKLYDSAYESAFNLNEEAIEDLSTFALSIFCKNKDMATQKSVNYYLRKAGVKTLRITAFF